MSDSILPPSKNAIKFQNLSYWVVCLIVITYPFSLKICNALVILFGINWLAWLLTNRLMRQYFKSLTILMLLPFILCVVALLYTENLSRGVFIVDKKIALFILPLALGSMPAFGKLKVEAILNVLTGSMVIACLYCLLAGIYRLATGISGGLFWQELTAPLGEFHPTYMSLILNFLVFFIGNNLDKNWNLLSNSTKLGLCSVVVLFLVMLVLLGSKLQLAITVLIVGYLLFKMSKKISLKIILPLILCFIAGAAMLLKDSYTVKRFSSITNFNYELDAPVKTFNELTNRLAIIECSWFIIRENALIGVGPGDIDTELDKVYRKVDYKFGYLDQQNPHNEYLSQWLGLGAIGLLVFLATLFIPLRIAQTERNYRHFVLITMFLLSFIFESVLERQKGIIFFALFHHLLLFHDRGDTVQSQTTTAELKS